MTKKDKKVEIELTTGYTVQITSGNHRLIADEPAAIGGAELGPDPYAYLLAGLGACTAITLRMYADRKKWPLKAVKVSLRHHRNHPADCADCDSKEVRIDMINKELELIGELTSEQITRLKEISDRCPVQKTIELGVAVETKLVNNN
jgi:putative redox protein